MRTIAKTVFFVIVLSWIQGAGAGDVTVREQGGAIVLESIAASSDMTQDASAPAAMPAAASPAQAQPAQAQPAQAAPSATRVPVKAYYDKVDRANIEKRIADRAARTKKRSLEAEKDATERAAKAQANQPGQQGQGAQTAR
ncbi:hypothetical protein FGKAn22_14070 [Ferrigenium kumadai]|uniref:Uncharacterized protein n=1 Tax=Ferrigenium kumadai TaxID=1682490 RepID=A0AAN1T1J3_9PROT|nr:hypothetical protein [Ferrigenium kumadai]BBI99714.1 hypothetical protein FGKAn22_14070 [Ferrigenium kumadai]